MAWQKINGLPAPGVCVCVCTCSVAVHLVCLQTGHAGVLHAQLQVIQFLSQLLNVAFFTVQLHLQLVTVRAFLCQLLHTHTHTININKTTTMQHVLLSDTTAVCFS